MLAACGVVCVLVVISGCAPSSETPDRWTTPKVPDPVPSFAASDALPFDAYTLSDSESEELQVKHAALLNRCLKDYGVETAFAGDFIKQISDDPSRPYWFQWGGRPGFLPLRQAEQFAYAQPPGASWVNGYGFYLSSVGNIYNVPSADPVQNAKVSGALYGPDHALTSGPEGPGELLDASEIPRDQSGALPPAGGCSALVERQIAVPVVDLRPIGSKVFQLALNDRAVAKVNGDWVRCMQEAGYAYPRFDAAINDAAGTPDTAKIAVAVADVNCTQSSGWPKTFYFVLAAYQRQAIHKRPEFFQSALAAEHERLHKVKELLARE